ncbi:hypothetical protein V1281_000158 [Nitrobacteraceae bacterium AZCC 2161]
MTVVHVIETGKFVAAWADYRTAVAALAMSDQSDPVLGNPRSSTWRLHSSIVFSGTMFIEMVMRAPAIV